jgi:hypothetical protein
MLKRFRAGPRHGQQANLMRPAAVEPPITDLRGERVGLAVLSVHGHHIGVAREHHSTVGRSIRGRKRGKVVGPAPVAGGGHQGFNSQGTQVGIDIVDQG